MCDIYWHIPVYCQQLTRVHLKSDILPKWMTKMFYPQFVMFVYDFHDHNSEIQLDDKNPHFTKLQISECSTCDRRVETLQHRARRNIKSLMVKYVQVGSRILSQKFSWWTGTRGQVLVYGMRHSVRIPMISTMREGLLVKCIDWPLFCIEQHSDNVRKIALQLILNVSSDYERSSGLAALWRKSSIWFSGQFFGQNWWNFGWCHVLMACLTTYRRSQYCWRLKMIIICRKGIVQVIILLDVTGRN